MRNARRLAIGVLSLVVTALLVAAPARAATHVDTVVPPSVVQPGAAAEVWFRASTGSRCGLAAVKGSRRVTTARVIVRRPLLQFHWRVPLDAQSGVWRLTLACRRGHTSRSARARLRIKDGLVRGGSAPVHAGLRPTQAALTTSGTGRGGGAWKPFGTTLVAGSQWLGGGGVDVKSNGLVGCFNSCKSYSAYGIAFQCVELVNHLLIAKGWSARIWGDAWQLYGNAPAARFDKHPNGGGYVPVPGDIIVWHGGSLGFGHVAVVEWVADGHIGWVEQNSSPSGRSSAPLGPGGALGNYGRLVPTGFLHAKANVPPAPTPGPLQGSSPNLQPAVNPQPALPTPIQGGGTAPAPTVTPAPVATTAPTPAPTPVPTPAPPSPRVTLARGPAAPAGYRYAITLNYFAANANVSVSCRDSVDPGGFYTFTMHTDGAGNAFTQTQCYSGDHPDHWVIAGGVQSNHVSW